MGDFVGVPSLFPQGPDPLEMWRNAYSQPSPPQDDGKVQSLSQTYQVEPEYVRENLIDFQSRFAAQQLYSQTFKQEYPTLSRNLVTSQFVSRVRDDMGNLIETEGWWNGVSNAYNVARDTVAIGNIGTRAMLEGRDLYPYERRKIESARRLQRAHMQSEPGWFAAAAELAGTMQETLGYSLAAGAATGVAFPPAAPFVAGATAFATSFNLEAGNLYADLVMDGYTPAQAADIASKYGAAIAGFEAVGLKLAGKPIKELGRELIKKRGRDLLRRETATQATGRIFREYATGILGEATTEGVQEIISELGKARASRIYRPENLYEPEYYETFKQAFVHTAKGMVILGGLPTAVRLANDNVRIANSNYDYEKAKEAAEIRGKSKVPEAQRQVDAEAGETDTLNSSYYVRAQDFKSAVSEAAEKGNVTEKQVRETVEANSPGLMKKIDEAAERDGEVELTKTEFADAFDNTLFRETALLHTAFEENGLTQFEIKESEAIRDKMLKERGEEAAKELQDMDEFERQLREVRQDVTRQLGEAMQGMDAEQVLSAAAYSSAIIGFIRRSALQQNITPMEFYQKHFPRIVQQRLEGQQVARPQTLHALGGITAQPDLSQASANATPEQVAVFESFLPAKNEQGLFTVAGESVDPKNGRFVKMTEASQAFADGRITREQRDALVEIYMPVALDDQVYSPATPEKMSQALNKKQAPLVNAPVQEGQRVGLRLDIPAVKKGARVVAIHESGGAGGGSHIRYASAARVTNAEMSSKEKRAQQTAEGKKKDKLAVIYGDYTSISPEEAVRIATQALTDPAWRQVGFDPVRHSYYYDRKTGEPLVSADEVVQIGSQVFAKNAKVGERSDFLYSKEDVPSDASDWSHFPGAAEVAAGTRKDRLAFAKATGIRALENVDGWVFFEMPDGTVADNLVRDYTDLLWPDSTLLEFMQETKATFINTPAHELTEDEYVQNLINMVDNGMYVREFLESQPDFEAWKGIPSDKLIDEKVAQYESDPDAFKEQARADHAEAVKFAASLGDTLFSKEAAAAFDESPYNKKVVSWAKDKFGSRVAPNGKPIYQNFLEFFGDSVVLDDQGKPLVMYHGTRKPGFSEFDYKHLSHGLFGIGIYTTENSKVAGGYAGVDPDAKYKDLKGGGTYPLLVSIKNPIDMDAKPDLDKWRAAFPDVEFPDGIEKNEYAYRHVEAFYGIRSEAVGWKTRGAAKPFLYKSEKRQAPSARDINENKSSSPDLVRLATEIRELEKQGSRIHLRQKEKARLLMDDMGFKRDAYATGGFRKKYDKQVEIVSSELLQYSFRRPRDGSDNPNIPRHLDTYKVEYVDPYFGRQTVVVGALDGMDRTLRYAVEVDLSQRMLGAFGASIDWDKADNPYSLANGSYPFEGMKLEGKALNEITDAMREAQEAQFELDDLSEKIAKKEDELESLRETKDGQDITELVQNGLVRMGHDGITHLGGGRVGDERHRVYIAFEPSQIKSFYNKGDFSPSTGQLLLSRESDQRRVLGQAEVDGGNAIKKILLDPNAKPTTLMHELMHWNLEVMATIGLDIEAKVAQEGYEATMLEAQMLGDIYRLLKWSGFKGTLAEWRAMTINERREFHEAIAVSFERYLYEGVAPSRELRGVFSRLLDYIRGAFEELVLGYQRDYEREFGRELPGLNDDVRAIFGRMMSAERDVQAFLAESELDAMMMTREEWVKSGRDAQEYDEYEEEFKDSMYESKAELTQRRMDEVGVFTRAYELAARKGRAELKRIRAQIRQEVEAQVKLEAVYQLRSWMRSSTYQTEDGPVERKFYDADGKKELPRSLNREMVEAISPELAKKLGSRRMLSKDGVALDVVREMFGFETNEAMLQALADSRNQTDEITHRTDQRLLNEHTDLMDPVVQQDNIHAAVHNKIRQKVMARELKFLLNNGRASKVEMKAMAEAAIQIIETTPTGDINIAAYSRAAARARKKMLKALKDGDMEAAKFAKRQELLNEALVREGLKARKEVRSLVEMNKRVFKRRTDKALAEAGYDVTVVKAIRALLTRMGIGRVDFDPAEAISRFRQEDPEFYEEVRPQLEYFLGMDIAQPRVGDRRKPMEHLSVGDVRSLRLLAKRMMKRAKDKMTAKIGDRKANIASLRREAQETLESNVEVKRSPDDKSIFGKIRDYFSDVIRFEHLFRRIDGGKVGIWTQMFRQVKDAANKYRQELRHFLSKDPKTGKGFDFEGKLRSLDLKIPGGARTLTMSLPSADGDHRQVTIGQDGRHAKTELIHLAMHFFGNESNRKRLVGGYAGENATPEIMAQVEREIRQFLTEQIQKGVLTRKDFEFMQSVFDHFSGEDMLGRANKVMKSLRGYEMSEVKAEKFTIEFPDGAEEFGGGYIPVRFKDVVIKEDQGQGVLDEEMSLDQQASKMVNILPGFAKDRVKGEVHKELHLGLSHLANHAAEVYRFINMAEPIDNVSRVLQGRDLASAFRARFGDKAYRNLEGWLKRSAFQRLDRSDTSEVGRMLHRLARNANMGVMFLNIGNTLQNYAGLVIPMRRVGKRRIISALIHATFNKKLANEVAAKSTEMKSRLERQIFDIYSTQQKILTSEDGSWARLQQWSDKYAYVLQQITQNHVDVAVWHAAYNQETEAALKENVSAEDAEARAIAHADSVVRQSQMAGEKEDISAFEAGGPIYKALFPFKSWFINWMNNAATQGRLDLKAEDRSRAAAIASTYLYMLMIPAILAQAAVELARGDDFDDEDDGYGDDMLELFARSQFEQITGGLPFFSDVIRAGSNWYDDKYWNNRYPVVPWVRAIERVISAPVRKEPLQAGFEVATRMANLMGVPAVGVWDRVSLIGDEIAGELQSEGTYDFIRGAVTGKRSDLQRLSQ